MSQDVLLDPQENNNPDMIYPSVDEKRIPDFWSTWIVSWSIRTRRSVIGVDFKYGHNRSSHSEEMITKREEFRRKPESLSLSSSYRLRMDSVSLGWSMVETMSWLVWPCLIHVFDYSVRTLFHEQLWFHWNSLDVSWMKHCSCLELEPLILFESIDWRWDMILRQRWEYVELKFELVVR